MKIEDDFLEQEEFDKIQEVLMGTYFPWFYNDYIDGVNQTNKFQFIHYFYKNYTSTSSTIEIINPILNKIYPVSLRRIKANLLTRTSNIIENLFHVDNIVDLSEEKLKQLTTSIFYINTNNGYTIFEDGTKVESVANRLLTFPTNMKHTGTSCTDEKTRIVINFNYFK
jgi:hypothetical protein